MNKVDKLENELESIRHGHYRNGKWVEGEEDETPLSPLQVEVLQTRIREIKRELKFVADIELTKTGSLPKPQTEILRALIDRRNDRELWHRVGKTQEDMALFTFEAPHIETEYQVVCGCSDRELLDQFFSHLSVRTAVAARSETLPLTDEEIAKATRDFHIAGSVSPCPNAGTRIVKHEVAGAKHTVGNTSCQACLYVLDPNAGGGEGGDTTATMKFLEACPRWVTVFRSMAMAEYLEIVKPSVDASTGKQILPCYAGLLHTEMREMEADGKRFLRFTKKCDTCSYETVSDTPMPDTETIGGGDRLGIVEGETS